MRIIVASHNPAKIEAVRQAFTRQFAGAEAEVESVTVASGVAEQPIGDHATLEGATQRASNAAIARPTADFWVGLEGGIDTFDERLMAFAWIVIRGPGARSSAARTMTLPLPPAVKTLVDAGLELGEANDRVFATTNSKQKGGAFSLLTGGLYTREGVYADAVTIALVPFVNDLYH